IKQNPKITTKELAVLCGMTKDGVYYHIKKLKGKGYIVRDEGKRHGGQWIVIDGHSDTKKIGGS
ncbi:MAG: winged helix-turn-helix domain-containing protein, partial [archaeon]|nr:winged helix-turn-helix domain-containing protein [archaeon]